jgi:transposase
MSTWPNRGGLRRPLRGAEREKIQNPNTVRPRRSDSSQQASSKPGAVHRRLCGRMDKPRANTATAHKLARMVYFMLTRGEAFVDQGQQRYEEQQRERSVAALKRRAAALGFQVTPTGAAA